MRESSVVQAFLEEGRVEEARHFASKICHERFGKINPRVREFLNSLQDVEAIEEFGLFAMKAKSWKELLPKE